MEQRRLREMKPGQVFFRANGKAWLVVDMDVENEKADLRELNIPDGQLDNWLLVDGYLEKVGCGRMDPQDVIKMLEPN